MIAEAERLEQLFKLRAMTSQASFGKEHGVGSASMVWQYLHGRRRLNLESAIKFARGLNVQLEDFSPRLAKERDQLLGYSDQRFALQEYARVPCVCITVSKASRRFTAEPIGLDPIFIAFRHDWLTARGLDGGALLATECNDDAMRPTLTRGDMVIINTADTELEDAAVYGIGYEEQFLVRRLLRDEGAWWLASDDIGSQRFKRKRYVEKHCFMLGKVVHRQSEVI